MNGEKGEFGSVKVTKAKKMSWGGVQDEKG